MIECGRVKNFCIDEVETFGIDCIYYITHIDNLSNILQRGILSPQNIFFGIDIFNLKDREGRVDPVFGRDLNSYVSLYFNPKNSILLSKKDMQEEIIILAVSSDVMFKKDVLFTDGDALKASTKFYADLKSLKELDKDCIFGNLWSYGCYGKSMREAEILIPNFVEDDYISKIICNSYKTLEKVDLIVKAQRPLPSMDYEEFFLMENGDLICDGVFYKRRPICVVDRKFYFDESEQRESVFVTESYDELGSIDSLIYEDEMPF